MPEFQVVRAAAAEPRLEGANLNDIGRDAFVDVKQVFGRQASPRWWLAATIALFVAAVVAAVVLFAPPSNDGSLKRGEVTLAGVDISRDPVTLDVSHAIPMQIKKGAPRFANRATLRLSAAGVPLGKTSARVVNGKALFKTDALRYLASGSLEGKLELAAGSKQLATATFPAKVDRAWYLTAFGLGSLLVLLAGLAYLESSVRPLRRGRRRISSYIGCALSVAVMAIGLIGFVTALGHANPTTGGVIVSAALAALGGVALAVTLRRAALHKGIRRAVKHAERAYSAPAAA
jgi:serine/threonine-protein kinase